MFLDHPNPHFIQNRIESTPRAKQQNNKEYKKHNKTKRNTVRHVIEYVCWQCMQPMVHTTCVYVLIKFMDYSSKLVFFFSSRKNANDSNTEKQKHKQRREEMVSEDESSVQHTSHGALSDS